MILTAHQPVYLPWLDFFHKLALADAFVIFDGVQFERHGYSNRVRIKTHAGPLWLTVPVEHGQPKLCDARIAPGPWARKHLKSIEFAYGKAPHFERYFEPLHEILSREWGYLAPLNAALLDWCMRELGIAVPVTTASEQNYRGEKSGLVLDMCKSMRATTYVFGALGRDYADVEAFRGAEVATVFQDYQHPTYPQLHGPFVPGLSVLDLLMNCGPESLAILMRRNVSRETLEAA